jgi:hypothetical protein
MAEGRDIGALILTLQANISDLSKSLIQVQSEVRGTAEHVTADLKKVSNSWVETMKGFLTAEAILGAFRMLKSVAVDSMKAFDDQAVAMARLTKTYGEGAQELLELALAKQKITRYSQDETLAAAQTLSIHKLNAEQIKQLLPVIMDYAAKTGKDLTSATHAFGYAIQYGATRGLRQFGVEIDKTGSQQEIFNELLKSGEGNVKGMAEEMGALGLGPLTIMKNMLHEVQQNLGEKLIPYFNDIVTAMPTYIEWFGKFVSVVDKLGKGFGFIGVAAQSIVSGRGLAGIKEYYAAEALYIKQSAEAAEKAKTAAPPAFVGLSTAGSASGRGGKAPKEVEDLFSTLAATSLANYKARMEFIRAENDSAFRAMTITVEQYYTKEYELMFANYHEELIIFEAEKAHAEEKLKTTNDVAEAKKIEKEILEVTAKITQLELKYQTDLVKKTAEHSEELKKVAEAQKKVAEETEKAIAVSSGDIYKAGIGKDATSQLKAQQDAEITTYSEHLAKLYDMKLEAGADQLALDRQIAKQETLIKDTLYQHTIELAEAESTNRLAIASHIAGGIADTMWKLYEITGKQSKETFALWKAAALAQAIVDTAGAVMTAYAAGWEAGGPYAGAALSAVYAAIAFAEGAVQIATISMTNMGKGGPLFGPSHSEGGIPIEAEGGEYMQPKGTVAYYGQDIMEAIRVRAIPRELLAGHGSFPVHSPSGSFFESGGLVASRSGDLIITNLVDHRLFDQYLSTVDGKNSLLNIISANQYEFKRVLQD